MTQGACCWFHQRMNKTFDEKASTNLQIAELLTVGQELDKKGICFRRKFELRRVWKNEQVTRHTAQKSSSRSSSDWPVHPSANRHRNGPEGYVGNKIRNTSQVLLQRLLTSIPSFVSDHFCTLGKAECRDSLSTHLGHTAHLDCIASGISSTPKMAVVNHKEEA